MNAKTKLNVIQDDDYRYGIIGFAETLSNCFSSKNSENFDIFLGDDQKLLKRNFDWFYWLEKTYRIFFLKFILVCGFESESQKRRY